ncbi:MAG: MoxR family ATPase [Clostridiales bacterium]|nr:MoxR family ATPase [Clostridiales bacterium]
MAEIELMKKIINNVEKAIVGKREVIELTIISLSCRGHVLIEDVPGVGKTTLASAIAKSASCSFRRIQFTPDVLPSDITGFSIYNQKTGEFEFRQGMIMSQFILADEINRTSPKTQASLLEVMEENQITVDGVTYPVPLPFMVLATQNPVEYVGTFPLPEAQLDRFFMKISIGYPAPSDESHILSRFGSSPPLNAIVPVASGEDIMKLQSAVDNIHSEKNINRYIIDIVNQTRKNPDILLGSSPRGSLCLHRASKARALYQGRDFVLPDDVKKMVIPVLSHRIILKQEARIRKISPEEILDGIVHKIQVPVL